MRKPSRRLDALALMDERGEALPVDELVARFGVSRGTAFAWCRRWRYARRKVPVCDRCGMPPVPVNPGWRDEDRKEFVCFSCRLAHNGVDIYRFAASGHYQTLLAVAYHEVGDQMEWLGKPAA